MHHSIENNLSSSLVTNQGPFVQVDELMEIFRRCKLPDSKLFLGSGVCDSAAYDFVLRLNIAV